MKNIRQITISLVLLYTLAIYLVEGFARIRYFVPITLILTLSLLWSLEIELKIKLGFIAALVATTAIFTKIIPSIYPYLTDKGLSMSIAMGVTLLYFALIIIGATGLSIFITQKITRKVASS